MRREPQNEAPRPKLLAPTIRRASPKDLAAVWHELLRGEWAIVDIFDDDTGRRLVLARLEDDEVRRPWHRLTARERTVVAAVAAGCSNREIAEAMGVSVSTAAGHLRAACMKLGGARRLDLVREWRATATSESGTAGIPRATDDARRRLSASMSSPLVLNASSPVPSIRRLRAGVGGVVLGQLTYEVAQRLPPFTDAERSVLCALLEGKTNAQIAAGRGTSPRTVANQVARLYRKMHVTSRAGLAARVRCTADSSTSDEPDPDGATLGQLSGALRVSNPPRRARRVEKEGRK